MWTQENPAGLWHPLLWLPERLAGRYDIREPDTCTVPEDDETWAVRVCLKSASGMYYVESGTWADVLSMYDLDLDDLATLRGFRSWQLGATDPVLDGIDLAAHIDVEDRQRALHTATALMGDLRPASWAILANDLLATIDDLTNPPPLEPGRRRRPHPRCRGHTDDRGQDTPRGRGRWARRPVLGGAGARPRGAPLDEAGVLNGPIASISAALFEVRDTRWHPPPRSPRRRGARSPAGPIHVGEARTRA